MLDFQKLSAHYQQALLRQVVPFWTKHSVDKLCGGYFDLLSATGSVIEGDKVVALQAQQVWAFSWLYNTFDGQASWLNHALHGATFLGQFAHTSDLNCYEQLDRRGRPTAPSCSFLPNGLAVMAYTQLYRATGNDEWAMLAKQVFAVLLQERDAERTRQVATIGGFRQTRQLSEVATFFKMVLELQPLLDEETWKQHVEAILTEILTEFVDLRTDTLRELILPEGAFMNTPEGRRINVGLAFQTASYLLDFFEQSALIKFGNNQPSYRKLATQVMHWCSKLCDQAWDEINGGLNQYVDFKQQPLLFPDWQQRWAWVHVEALATLVKCYVHTQQPDCLKWFKRIHDYVFRFFPDDKYIGWHLGVDQSGQPLLAAKAIPSVGCFSLIRCLAESARYLQRCESVPSKGKQIRATH